MTRDQKKAAIDEIKKSMSLSVKPALIDALRKMEGISLTESRKLERIIVRLETWQNS